jgi:sulfonate transport system permease protein
MSAAPVLERPAVEPHQDPALAGRDDIRPTGKRLGPGRRRRLAWLLGPGALLALWTISSATGLLDPRILSEPWTVVATAGELFAGRLQENLAISAQRAAWGCSSALCSASSLPWLPGSAESARPWWTGRCRSRGQFRPSRCCPCLSCGSGSTRR